MQMIVMFAFVAVCLITDLRTRKIYNSVILSGLAAALALNTGSMGLFGGAAFTVSGLLTGIILLIIPFILGGLGAGDVKMLGMIGAFVGHNTVVEVLVASAVAGGVLALVVMLKEGGFLRRMKKMVVALYCFIFVRKTVHLEGLEDKQANHHALPYAVALTVGVIVIYIMGSMNYAYHVVA